MPEMSRWCSISPIWALFFNALIACIGPVLYANRMRPCMSTVNRTRSKTCTQDDVMYRRRCDADGLQDHIYESLC